MSNKEIYDILGIEADNRKNAGNFAKQFKRLMQKGYEAEQIWFKGDYGVYTDGDIVAATADLVAVSR